ncbi:MAG: hypothetical protein PSN44_01630 [Gammaproteobacteria bacterium]|nr:hypothetical protein [Gammaproteobacteria bacterium]
MSVQSIKSKRDREIILTANHQLEQMYFSQNSPCLALHISRNYHLLHAQYGNVEHRNQWKEKAKIWWQLYWGKRSSKAMGLFYDEDKLFLDNI